MKGYWLTFTDGSHGYCQGENEYDAILIAEKATSKTVKHDGTHYQPKLQSLPYPANPVIWQFDHPVNGKTPPFCHRPNECAGRTACPQRYSCTE